MSDDFSAKDEKASTWLMTMGDLRWFEQHKPQTIRNPNDVLVLLEKGDELLDYREAENYYQNCHLDIAEGGDHRMTDFADKLPQVFEFIFK